VSRKQALLKTLKHVHIDMIAQDRSDIIRYIDDEDDKKRWDQAFQCLFVRFRLLDVKVDDVSFEEKAKQATVRVRISGHVLDTLATEQAFLEESWRHDEGRWVLDPGSELLKKMLSACYPEG